MELFSFAIPGDTVVSTAGMMQRASIGAEVQVVVVPSIDAQQSWHDSVRRHWLLWLLTRKIWTLVRFYPFSYFYYSEFFSFTSKIWKLPKMGAALFTVYIALVPNSIQ